MLLNILALRFLNSKLLLNILKLLKEYLIYREEAGQIIIMGEYLGECRQ